MVGASLAGIRSVEFLRRKKCEAEIVLVGQENHLPYDRPPLSKELLRGEWGADKIALRKKSYDDLKIDVRLGQRAVALDVASKEIQTSDGATIGYDGLVIATGASARKLCDQPELPGVFTLRTLDDAIVLAEALKKRPRVVVIGAGFIGAEVAASCRQLGLEVSMVEALDVPLCNSLGKTLGGKLASLHESHGVDVRCGVKVDRIEGGSKVERVCFADGSNIECDLVVVGIGVVPSVQWLQSSGIEIDNGVVCDASCRASAPGVFAAGDVANWYNPLFEERMRVEHWSNAVEQARHVVDTMLTVPGEEKPFESAPLFWSDQYDLKIQGAGRPRADDTLHVCHGSLQDDAFVVLYGREDRLMGAVAFNQPVKLVGYRRMIQNRTSWAEALEAAQA